MYVCNIYIYIYIYIYVRIDTTSFHIYIYIYIYIPARLRGGEALVPVGRHLEDGGRGPLSRTRELLCVYTYIYIYIYMYISKYIYIYTHTRLSISLSLYISLSIYIYIYIHAHTCVYIYILHYITKLRSICELRICDVRGSDSSGFSFERGPKSRLWILGPVDS